MARKMADCRRFESESNCSLTIIGEEDEVISAAAQHAAAIHGHQDTPELREQLRAMLEPEHSYTPGARQTEPPPSYPIAGPPGDDQGAAADHAAAAPNNPTTLSPLGWTSIRTTASKTAVVRCA
jgi:hypothetical protein